MITVAPCAEDNSCQDPSYKVSLFIEDDEVKNKADPEIPTPMIFRKLKVEVEFLDIFEFDMYHDEAVSVNFYKNGNDNIKSW